MSKVYGPIEWSTVGAPNPLTGICKNFTWRAGDQLFKVPGVSGIAGLVYHGGKGTFLFASNPPGTIVALPIRAGAELAVSGFAGGKNFVQRVSADWRTGAPLDFAAEANRYPGVSGEGVGEITTGTITLARTAKVLQLPADKIWWGTESVPKAGLTGIVQALHIEESVQIDETADDDQEGAPIVAVAIDNYEGSARLDILTAATELPEEGAELALFGGFRVNGVEASKPIGGKRQVTINGILIPGVTEAEGEGEGEGEGE